MLSSVPEVAPETPSRARRAVRSDRRVVLRGFAVLGRGAAQQKLAFSLSVLGSSLWALMTVGQAYVLGPDHPAHGAAGFPGRTGRAGARCSLAALLIMAVAVLKALGIAGRRIYAGRVQYELGATYRRQVAARYLALPLRWHQSHPTGRLLSVANSDVEQTWEPMAPFPMAVGVVVMLLVTLGFLVATDPVLAARRRGDLPADRGAQRDLQPPAGPADDPGPGAAGRGERAGPREFRRRPDGQGARPRRTRRRSGSPSAPGSCATR